MKFLSIFIVGIFLSMSAHAKDINVTLVVGGPVGGALDNIARILKDQIESHPTTRYKVEVLNRPGNGAVAATNFFLADRPGQDNKIEILLIVSSILIPAYLQNSLPPDTVTKLVPLTMVGKMRPLVHANPNFPINNLKDLDSLGKSHITYTTPGVATTLNLIAEQIQKQIKTPLTHVPVPSTPNALSLLMGNHVDLVFDVGQYYTTATSGKTKIVSIISDNNWTELSNDLLITNQLHKKIEHDLSYYIIFGNQRNNPDLQEKISQDLKTLMSENQQIRQSLQNLHLGLLNSKETNNSSKIWNDLIKKFKELAIDSAIK
jgi:tripartite-type tricarboxylate transporter receptor subunit TctC